MAPLVHGEVGQSLRARADLAPGAPRKPRKGRGMQVYRAEFGADLAAAGQHEDDHIQVRADMTVDSGTGLQPYDVGV